MDSEVLLDVSQGTLLPNQQIRTLSQSARAFIALDGLRGIAALAVAVRHAPYLWQAGYPTGFLHESYLAVDFFFVLSGFVLAYAYGERLQTGMSAQKFISVRLIRLYPLYLLAFSISMILLVGQWHFGKISAVDATFNAVFAILFVPSLFSQNNIFPMNSPAWSLFFELAANFVFGLLGKRINTLILVLVVFVAALTLLLAVAFGWLGFGTANGPMDAGPTWRSISAGLARVSYSFFAGVLAYRLWRVHSAKIVFSPLILVSGLSAILMACPPEGYQISFDLLATVIIFPAIVFFWR